MTVVTARNAIIGAGDLNLIIFYAAKFQTRFFESGLQKTTATATAVIVGPVGRHIDEVFLTYNGFDNETKVFGDWVSIAFAYDLTGILNREFDF